MNTFPPIPEVSEIRIHTRVMILCVAGASTLYMDVGIPLNADPEVALKDRLTELRSSWPKVTYTTGIAG